MNPDAFRLVDVVKNGLSVDATIAPGDVLERRQADVGEDATRKFARRHRDDEIAVGLFCHLRQLIYEIKLTLPWRDGAVDRAYPLRSRSNCRNGGYCEDLKGSSWALILQKLKYSRTKPSQSSLQLYVI